MNLKTEGIKEVSKRIRKGDDHQTYEDTYSYV